MRLQYTNRARTDIDQAFAWYERQQCGLGFEFLDSIELSIKNILQFPEMYPFRYANFRCCVIRKFPFSIFYSIENNEIIIHSVFDNRQDPDKLP